MSNDHEPMTCMNKTSSDLFRWQKIPTKAKNICVITYVN